MFAEDRLCEWSRYQERLDRAIEWLLILLLAFMPLAFGAVEAWSEEIVVTLTAAICLCFCARQVIARGPGLPWTWAYLPVLAFVAVAVVQLTPLPIPVVKLLSPNTVAQKMKAFADAPGGDASPSMTALSFYTYATRHDLRLMLGAAVVFVAVLGVFRRPDQIVRLLLAITLIGAGVALVSLAQNVVGNDKIYWFVSNPHGTALSGPFVNHNHYAQFMNLSLGAALALVFVKMHEALAGRRTTPAAVMEYLSSTDGRLIWGCAAMIVLGTATIFSSLSRGGMISLMIAGAFTTLVLSSTRSLRGSGWVMALLALGAFVCVLYIGFDAVYDRLGSLRALHQAEGGRWQIVRDIAVAWTRFPVLGTGLGTHEVVYPMFDRSMVATVASHAENEYAQAAEETGLVGMVVLIAFGVLVWRSYAHTIRAERRPIRSAAYGLGFGLLAIMVQSLSDFGQHVPANMFLSVIFCALLLRLPYVKDYEGDESRSSSVRHRRYWIAALAILTVVWGVALLDADWARLGQAHWRQVLTAENGLMERQWQGSDEEYAYLLTHAQKAAAYQPGNVIYRHWLSVYRWRDISRLTDPNTGEPYLPVEALPFAERIAEELKQTRALCPTFGATWCVLGQLERAVLGRTEEGARNIREGVRLAPCNPTARLVAGLLEAEEGNSDIAVDHLVRAAQLDSRLFREVAVALVEQFDRADRALQVAEGDLHHLTDLADILEASKTGTKANAKVGGEVLTAIRRKCDEPGVPTWGLVWLAEACKRQGRDAEAIACYRRAVDADFTKADWHYRLATLLEEAGSFQEALREAQACLQLRPDLSGPKMLIERLSGSLHLMSQGNNP